MWPVRDRLAPGLNPGPTAKIRTSRLSRRPMGQRPCHTDAITSLPVRDAMASSSISRSAGVSYSYRLP